MSTQSRPHPSPDAASRGPECTQGCRKRPSQGRRDEYDVTWAQTSHPGASDEKLLEIAQTEERVLLTFDTDFGTLAVHKGLPASSGIILFRLTLTSPKVVAETVRDAIQSRSDWKGHFSVVDDTQIRMRPLRK